MCKSIDRRRSKEGKFLQMVTCLYGFYRSSEGEGEILASEAKDVHRRYKPNETMDSLL